MTRKRYYKKKYYKKNNNNNEEYNPLAMLIALIFMSCIGFYNYYILPNIEAFKFYGIIFLVVVTFLLCLYLFYIIKKRLNLKKDEAKKIENIPNFLLELEKKIKEFKPIRQYKEEVLYQTELVGFLKNKYPDVEIEQTRDYSRPDIIIDDIAIEIKGPTDMSALKTLPDKINSYIPKWDYLFIVLFNIQIVPNKEKSMELYEIKKKQILENTIESKRDKVFFIEI